MPAACSPVARCVLGTGVQRTAKRAENPTIHDGSTTHGTSGYFDVFWLCAVLGVLLVFLVPMMKRSVAEKGAHVGAE
jgi:hypothetical protein